MNFLEDFLKEVRSIVPAYKGELLNVTIRDVRPDSETSLSYAKTEMFGLVMLFNYSVDRSVDEQMGKMTRDLIDAVHTLKGTYYLPYRLHASRDQFKRIYPSAEDFFLQKRRFDPSEIFQNKFYLAYK